MNKLPVEDIVSFLVNGADRKPVLSTESTKIQTQPKIFTKRYQNCNQKVVARKMEGGQVPERAEIEKKPWRKRLEDLWSRPPALPPSLRGTPEGAREVTAESRIAITKAPRNRQSKISGATAVLDEAGEEPGARTFSGVSPQRQEIPTEEADGRPRSDGISTAPSLKGVPYGASKGTRKNPLAGAEERTDRQDKISGTTTAHTGAGEEMGA